MPKDLKYLYLILAIIPFIIILLVGYFADIFDPRSHFHQILDQIMETDLESWMARAGFKKWSGYLFQVFRVITAIAMGLAVGYFISFVLGYFKDKFLLLVLVVALVWYKLTYYYLRLEAKANIAFLNQQLPYAMKTIIYLCHIYPLNNALLISIDYVPEVFQEDIIKLVQEIDDDASYQPYQNFIDRYNGELKNLDMYLSSLYRMTISSTQNDSTMLSSLNKMIDDEVSRVRIEKNEQVNKRISTIGNIPVFLLSGMLIYLLIIMTDLL